MFILRLTAPYFFALGVVQLTMKWFHYNSVFDPPTDDHLNCPKYWWRNLLYINTLFPVQDMVSKRLHNIVKCFDTTSRRNDNVTVFVTVHALELVLGRRHAILHTRCHSSHTICSVRDQTIN